MDQLAALRAYVRIVEAGSFTQASASLGMPKATVTKLIQSLEAHLRTKLLSRTTRQVSVTSDGAAYYERAVRLLADLDELDGSLTTSQTRPRGRLRVDMSGPLAQHVILPALGEFLERYPDIRIDIGASDRTTDLLAENVDCVLRAGDLSDQSLIARRIADLHMVTCASPAYLARHGAPATPEALERDHVGVIYFSASTGRHRPFEFCSGGELVEVAPGYRVSFNEAGIYVLAVLAGHGVAQVPYFTVREHLASGRLQRVMVDWPVPVLPLHVVYPPNRHLSAKLRVFVDWIAGVFGGAAFLPPQ
jgi:LysR family transcriptional regulator for bpeEF and oprC